MRILIAGGSGLIGTALQLAARRDGHETAVLVRREPSGANQWRWQPGSSVPAEAIEWADAVVNLAGAPIGKLPWTARYRRELVSSRLVTTATLAEAITAADHPPRVFANASGVGFYGDRRDEVLTEASGPGTGFLAGLCQLWERQAMVAADATRVVTLRTGLVLGDGGALGPLTFATRLGLGGRLGPGTQVWPWIAMSDEIGAILHTLTADAITGPVNLAAPVANTSNELTSMLAELMGRPHVFAVPAPLLRLPLGMAADEILLGSQHVEPAVLLASGYEFTQTDLRAALAIAMR